MVFWFDGRAGVDPTAFADRREASARAMEGAFQRIATLTSTLAL